MFSSWANGFLKSLFGDGVDNQNKTTAEILMEETFDEIKIDHTPNGEVRAFFAKQTLVGDDSLRRSMRYRGVITNVDMEEPMGIGRTREAAIANLWKKMTNLQLHENILQFENYIYGNGAEMQGSYTRFKFKDGRFVNQGLVTNEQPPARPTEIEEFLANEEKKAKGLAVPSAEPMAARL